ncbi:MAG: hypothetical protein Q9160_001260 [Pyrenula sp. 1 TL-2023]
MAAAELTTVLGVLTWDRLLGLLLVLPILVRQASFPSNPLTDMSSLSPSDLYTISLFFAQSVRSGKYAQKLKTLHLHYGPVVRVAPDEVSVIDQRAWTTIYSGTNNFPKSQRWFSIRPNGAFGILGSPKESHGRFRRAFAPAFTEKVLTAKELQITRHVEALVEKLDDLAGDGSAVNITDELEYAAFDIGGDFGFSKQFNCLGKADNRRQVHLLQKEVKIFTMRAMQRVLGVASFQNLFENAMTSMKQTKTVYQKKLTGWTNKRLDDGDSEPGDDKEDLMTVLARSTGPNKTLSPAEAENSLGDFMIAGTETIATMVDSALYHLLRTPIVMTELRAEIRAAVAHGSSLSTKKLADLTLLNAVINETMRLTPSIPASLTRVVPPPGAEICGYFMPGNTYVSFCQYAAYRNPSNFSEPDRFLPRRWTSPEAFKRHNAEIFHPFSVGPRNCIGKGWGLMAVRALLANVLVRFDLERVEPHWRWEEQNSWFIWEKKDLMVRIGKVKG